MLASHTEASDAEDEDELGFSSDTSAPRAAARAPKAAAAAGANPKQKHTSTSRTSPVLSAASSHSSARSGGRSSRRGDASGGGPEEIPLKLLELSVASSSPSPNPSSGEERPQRTSSSLLSHPFRPLQAPVVAVAAVSSATTTTSAAAASESAAALRARGGGTLPRIDESADSARVWEPDPSADVRSPSSTASASTSAAAATSGDSNQSYSYDSIRRNRTDLLAMKEPPSLSSPFRLPPPPLSDQCSLGTALIGGDSMDVSASAAGFGPAFTCTKGPLLTQVMATSRSPIAPLSTLANTTSQLTTSLISTSDASANPYNQTWSTGSLSRHGPLKSCLKPPTKKRIEDTAAAAASDTTIGDALDAPVTEYYVSLNAAAPPPGFQNDDVPMDPKVMGLRGRAAAKDPTATNHNDDDENETLLHNFPPRRHSTSPNGLSSVRGSSAPLGPNANGNGGNDSSGCLSNSTSSNTVLRSPSETEPDPISSLLTHPDNLAGLGWPQLPTPELLASTHNVRPRAGVGGAPGVPRSPPASPRFPPTAIPNHYASVPDSSPPPDPIMNHHQNPNQNQVQAQNENVNVNGVRPGMFVPALGIRWPLFSLLMSLALLSCVSFTTLAYVDPTASIASDHFVRYRERSAPLHPLILKPPSAQASRTASGSGAAYAGLELNVTLFVPPSLGVGRVRIISSQSARLTIAVDVDGGAAAAGAPDAARARRRVPAPVPSRAPEVLELSGEWRAPSPWAESIEALEYRRETPTCSNCSHGCDPLSQLCLCPPGFQLESPSPSSTRCVGTACAFTIPFEQVASGSSLVVSVRVVRPFSTQ